MRVLATVANNDGEIIERVPNPPPLQATLKEVRHLSRRKSCRSRGSRRYIENNPQDFPASTPGRGHYIHCSTTVLPRPTVR